MAPVSFLPRVFHWAFAVLAALCALGAVGVVIAMLIDPHLPPGTHFGPMAVDFAGQPGSIVLQPVGNDSNFTVTAFKGTIELFVEKAGGLVEVAKQYGLPVLLINVLFLALLFELLRRLFRNVERRESFTRQSVLLVQIVGLSLMAFSIVSAFAESFFARAVYGYIAGHATVTISGAQVHFPAPHGMGLPGLHGFPFDNPVFFSGLLVLALSEVFRQGVTLKAENDLTV
jgi:hypothetical protein